jgi:hypothetical protein
LFEVQPHFGCSNPVRTRLPRRAGSDIVTGRGRTVNGIDFVIVTALLLLVALAVAAGLQLAQDRAEAPLTAVSKDLHRELQGDAAPARYCATCGRELHPPI